jgi:hypothetical protein
MIRYEINARKKKKVWELPSICQIEFERIDVPLLLFTILFVLFKERILLFQFGSKKLIDAP